jgi:hypothetical protein
VVRVLGCISGGPGSIPGTTRKKVVGLEWSPLSLVSTTEELLDRKVAALVLITENTAVGIRHADHVAPSIRKSLFVFNYVECIHTDIHMISTFSADGNLNFRVLRVHVSYQLVYEYLQLGLRKSN